MRPVRDDHARRDASERENFASVRKNRRPAKSFPAERRNNSAHRSVWVVVQLLEWISETGLSTWIRSADTVWAYPMIITFHAAGLAVMVGLSVVVALRILGIARDLPLAGMERLYPAIWLGFWVNAVSGAGLIISDPVGMLTNPLFLTKMLLVAGAIANVVLIQRRVIRSPGVKSGILPSGAKRMAFASLLLWTAATTMGRLTAYLGNQ
jgi:hypothetical protein